MEWYTKIDIPQKIKDYVECIGPWSGTRVFDGGDIVVRYQYMPATTFLKTLEDFDIKETKATVEIPSRSLSRVYCGKNDGRVTFAIYMR